MHETFNKSNLDGYLKELGKEYRKLAGKSMPAEIILIGGAAILANYGFRDMTTDVDAVIQASSAMKEALNRVGDKFNLPNGWLNDDFLRTDSYSLKLSQYSKHYRTFSNVLNVRTVSAEYLIAMKLRSGRRYKHDKSDVVGILAEHERIGNPVLKEDVMRAVQNLYGSWDVLSKESVDFIEEVFLKRDYEHQYTAIREKEELSRELLIDFEENYPGTAKSNNINDILDSLMSRRKE